MEIRKITEECTGCSRIVDGYCRSYVNPAYWWERGGCPLNDVPQEHQAEVTKKLNPLKASKGKGQGPIMPRKHKAKPDPHRRGRYLTGLEEGGRKK